MDSQAQGERKRPSTPSSQTQLSGIGGQPGHGERKERVKGELQVHVGALVKHFSVDIRHVWESPEAKCGRDGRAEAYLLTGDVSKHSSY